MSGRERREVVGAELTVEVGRLGVIAERVIIVDVDDAIEELSCAGTN